MPNLILSLVLAVVLLFGFKKVWLKLVLLSLLADLFSGFIFGLVSLSLISTAYLLDWFNKKVFSVVSFWTLVYFALAGTFLYNLFLIGLNYLFGLNLVFNWFPILIESFYNLFLILVCYYGLKKILC